MTGAPASVGWGGRRGPMSYAFRGWKLYSWTIALTPGLEKTVYFFSKEGPVQGEPADPPLGYRATMGRKTGVPFLIKIDESRGAASARNSRT